MQPSSTLHFGPFYLDGTDDGLWRGPQRCQLTAKASAVLRYLVEHPNRLVRRTTLMAAVWPDVHVSDWALTTCIREIRHVLGDVAKAPQYIATVHRQGYRFIAPVTVADTPPPLSISEVPPPPLRSAQPAPELSQSPPTAAALDEEHKLVTVLCCALADAPALAARLGPERLYHLLRRWLGWPRRCCTPTGAPSPWRRVRASRPSLARPGPGGSCPAGGTGGARAAPAPAACPALRAQLPGESSPSAWGCTRAWWSSGGLGRTRSGSPRRWARPPTWRCGSSSRRPPGRSS